MPKAPPTPCRAPRCREMASKSGMCAKHYVKPKAWVSSEGKSASERGYGPKWRKTRKRILIRDSYLCQECKRGGIVTLAREVDHVLNKAAGGSEEDSNLESICITCHKKKTLSERRKKYDG